MTISFGPLGVAPLEGKQPQFGRQMRGRIRNAAGDERGRHGGREADALKGVSLLQFGAGSHGSL